MIRTTLARPRNALLAASAAVALLAVVPSSGLASNWPHDPNTTLPICLAAGSQYRTQIATDDQGGAILVWCDDRSGDSDIYAARVDAYGNIVWGEDGLPLCTAEGVQAEPVVVADGAGGAIIAWSDERTIGNWNIYAQRVDETGATVWGTNGIAICTASGTQYRPRIVRRAPGSAIIVWTDQRGGADDVYAQAVSGSGPLWSANGIAVCNATGNQYDSEVVADGVGGVIITWVDTRGADYDIYAQRLDGEGNEVWFSQGQLVCGASDTQFAPMLASDGVRGAIIVWVDYRNGGVADIYAQRMVESGFDLWAVDGVPICTAAMSQHNPVIASDGASGAVVAWADVRNGTFDIYAQRVSAAGTSLWTPDGDSVCVWAGAPLAHPAIVSDGNGGAIIAWEDSRTWGDDIYAQHMTGDGAPLWVDGGVALCTAAGTQDDVVLASDGAGGAIASWEENDIHVQRIERNGYLGYPSPVVTEVADAPNDQGGYVVATWTASWLDAYPHQEVTHYSLWRRTPPVEGPAGALPATLAPRGRQAEMEFLREKYGEELTLSLLLSGWNWVDEVTAAYLPDYAYLVPTFGDSTAVGVPKTQVMVIAHTAQQWTSWQSQVKAGYSVDDLPPGAPIALAAHRVVADVELFWQAPGDPVPDFAYYAVYRSTTPGFTPSGLGEAIATVADAAYVDAGAANQTLYYLVSAVDVHGNESPFSNEAQVLPTTDVSGGQQPVDRFALSSALPNPFRGATTLRYQLPRREAVTITVHDVSGRCVRRLMNAEEKEPGRYQVAWSGRDDTGDGVAAGVYFCRMEAGEFRAVRRLLLVR
jgi:hypothetical protein